jgi:hypothetical protein
MGDEIVTKIPGELRSKTTKLAIAIVDRLEIIELMAPNSKLLPILALSEFVKVKNGNLVSRINRLATVVITRTNLKIMGKHHHFQSRFGYSSYRPLYSYIIEAFYVYYLRLGIDNCQYLFFRSEYRIRDPLL